GQVVRSHFGMRAVGLSLNNLVLVDHVRIALRGRLATIRNGIYPSKLRYKPMGRSSLHLALPTAHQRTGPTRPSGPERSIVRRRPSASPISGSQPRISRARLISG